MNSLLRMTRRWWTIGCMAIASAVPASLPAQSDSVMPSRGDSAQHDAACFRGRPLPRCKTFFLTEFGLYTRVAPNVLRGQYLTPEGVVLYNSEERTAFGISGEVGFMSNTGPTAARGYSLALSSASGAARYAVKARRRRWLNPGGTAFDYGLGVVAGDVATSTGSQFGLGPTGEVALNEKDLVALFARADLLRSKSRTQPSLSIGVRGGAQAGLISAGATAILVVGVIVLILSSGGWND